MRLSDVLGMRVCSVFEGKKLGWIKSACFCDGHKKVSGFVVVNDDDEYDYYLPTKNIIEKNDNMLFVKNLASVCVQQDLFSSSLINKPAFWLDGGSIGVVRDVELGNGFEVEQIVFDNLTIAFDQLFNVGEDFCFFCPIEKRPKLNKFAPQKRNIQANPTVQIMQSPFSPTIVPPRIKAYDSLSAIGKIATKTVMGKNNEIIVRKGEIVCLDSIKKAKQHNVYLSF